MEAARQTYTYNPMKLTERGKDRLRFELGDTDVSNEGASAALSDEEYEAILDAFNGKWRRAKLACVESILHRFAYEVDEKVGPLTVSLRQRYESWLSLYDRLRAEVSACAAPIAHPQALSGAPYFYEGIHNNPTAGGTEKEGGRRLVP